MTEMWDDFKTMELAYTRVCRMFGESPKEIEPDELFKYLSEFFEQFKVGLQNCFLVFWALF